jgi:hypothetical protein
MGVSSARLSYIHMACINYRPRSHAMHNVHTVQRHTVPHCMGMVHAACTAWSRPADRQSGKLSRQCAAARYSWQLSIAVICMVMPLLGPAASTCCIGQMQAWSSCSCSRHQLNFLTRACTSSRHRGYYSWLLMPVFIALAATKAGFGGKTNCDRSACLHLHTSRSMPGGNQKNRHQGEKYIKQIISICTVAIAEAIVKVTRRTSHTWRPSWAAYPSFLGPKVRLTRYILSLAINTFVLRMRC